MDQIHFFQEKLYSVILKNECDYKRPVVYPDTLTTRSYVSHVGNSSFTMLYDIYSEQQDAVVAVGKSIIVIVDPVSFQKQAIPQQVRKHLIQYMTEFGYDAKYQQVE